MDIEFPRLSLQHSLEPVNGVVMSGVKHPDIHQKEEHGEREWSWLTNGLAYCTYKAVVRSTRRSRFDGLIYNDVIVR